MSGKKIRDILTFSKPLADMKDMLAVRDALPFLRPFFKMHDVDIDGIDASLEETSRLYIDAEKIALMPDRFNALFASRGWIMYESMDATVAESAIVKADSGDIDGAESELEAYYSVDTVAMHLKRMSAIQAFRPRMRLAELALTDYSEKRYHACIPIVMALLDGLVNEINQKRGITQGFHAEGSDLEAWNSIAAHSTGLSNLRDVISVSRKKTCTETITVPFRHGILHGMDLGYDNRLVAAKVWAALFAVREWALIIEQGRSESAAKSEEPKPTLHEVIMMLKQNEETKRRVEEWQPRTIKIGVDIPASGNPDDYQEATPERRLVEFFHWWTHRNYGRMTELIMKLVRVKPIDIKQMYRDIRLVSYHLIRITDEAPARSEVTTSLVVTKDGMQYQGEINIGLIFQDGDGNPMIPGEGGGEWWIQNWGHPATYIISAKD